MFETKNKKKIWITTIFLVLTFLLAIFVFAAIPYSLDDVIKIITPASIACYGADYPRPHFEQYAQYNQTCLNGLAKNVDDSACIINLTQVFVNTTFKVGDEQIKFHQQNFYCAHKRTIINPLAFNISVNLKNLNTTLSKYTIFQEVNGVWEELNFSKISSLKSNANLSLLFFGTKNPSETIKYDINAFGVTEDPFFTNFDTNNSLWIYYPFDDNFATSRTFLDKSGNGLNFSIDPIYTDANITWRNETGLIVNNTNGSAVVQFASDTLNHIGFVDTKIVPARVFNYTYCEWHNFTTYQENSAWTALSLRTSAGNSIGTFETFSNTSTNEYNFRHSGIGQNTLPASVPGGLIPLGTWQHVCIRSNITVQLPDNITETRIYYNGTLLNSTTRTNTSGCSGGLCRNWNGTIWLNWNANVNRVNLSESIDEMRFYSTALTNEQISNLSNTTYLNPPAAVSNLAPNINFVVPANATQFLYINRPFNFSWNVTDDTNTSLNCDLLINSSVNVSVTGVTAGAITSRLINTSLGFGYTWGVNCTDGSLTNQTPFRIFNVTHNPPQINLISPANASNFAYSARPFNFSWNATDDINTSLNCDILVNASSNVSITGITSGTNFSRLINLSRGLDYTWGVNCTDGDFTNQTLFRIFNVTNANPILTQNMTNVSIKLGQSFVRQVNASDDDGDTITYVNNQTQLFNISSSGLMNDTPINDAQTGNFTILLNLTDGFGGETTRTFVYQINNSDSPTISFVSPTEAQNITSGTNVSFNFTCSDDVNSTLNAALNINGTLNQSFNAISNNSVQELSRLFSIGSYQARINCTDGYSPTLSGAINFSVNAAIDGGSGGSGGAGGSGSTGSGATISSIEQLIVNGRLKITQTIFYTKNCWLTKFSPISTECSYEIPISTDYKECAVIQNQNNTQCRMLGNITKIVVDTQEEDTFIIKKLQSTIYVSNGFNVTEILLSSYAINLAFQLPIFAIKIPEQISNVQNPYLFKSQNNEVIGIRAVFAIILFVLIILFAVLNRNKIKTINIPLINKIIKKNLP